MIEIKQLRKTDLSEYIHSQEFKQEENIPISFHRAISQMHNPRIDDEDVLLLIAYNQNVLVGYLGILPDYLFANQDTKVRLGWLSCLWVSPKAQGQGLAKIMIEEALGLYEGKSLSVDYVEFTQKIYRKTNQYVHNPYSKEGLRLYLKSDLCYILPPKHRYFSKIKPLLRIVDVCSNVVLQIRLWNHSFQLPDLKIECVDKLNSEIEQFISDNQDRQLFKRNIAELQWMMDNPWIVESSSITAESKKYYFSSIAKHFSYRAIVVRNIENQIIAFMIFSNRNNILKIPFLCHNNSIDAVARIINYYMITWKIHIFTTFQKELIEKLESIKTPAFYTKRIVRNCMVTKPLEEFVFRQDCEIQDGDGDACFT